MSEPLGVTEVSVYCNVSVIESLSRPSNSEENKVPIKAVFKCLQSGNVFLFISMSSNEGTRGEHRYGPFLIFSVVTVVTFGRRKITANGVSADCTIYLWIQFLALIFEVKAKGISSFWTGAPSYLWFCKVRF